MKEAKRLSVLEQLQKGQMTTGAEALELGISPRQMKRLKKRFQLEGQKGVLSRRRGLPNCRKIPKEIEERAVAALNSPLYEGFGPTFKEKLAFRQKIYVSSETVRKWMIAQELWEPKKRKERKIYQRRARRSRFGELLQGDGSVHDWFEERGPKCSLVHFVDDATSKITAGKFFPAETTKSYLEVLQQQLSFHGRPLGFYSDKHSIFKMNRDVKGSGETHFNKVLKKLGIEHICAHSPQAKGRIERANGTLQDRLVKEMRLKGINNMEDDNAFLPKFIEDYNKRFGKIACCLKDAHCPLRAVDDCFNVLS